MNIKSITLLVTTLLLFVSVHANATLLLGASFSTNFPFGPFLPDEAIEVRVSLTNLSPDQTITICEGACIGDEFTYSLGGVASVPSGYTFFWGNVPAESVFDGQIAGVLLPGEEKVFVLGVYSPEVAVTPGLYGFSVQLQVFDATADRLMLTAFNFSGNWEVQDPILAIIDIKPSKKPENVIDLKKDKNLKIAIVGSEAFDALQVDPATVKFDSNKENPASPIRFKGSDYNRDGYPDLILTFKLNETGIACGDTEATLTGETYGGELIEGSDNFIVEPCP